MRIDFPLLNRLVIGKEAFYKREGSVVDSMRMRKGYEIDVPQLKEVSIGHWTNTSFIVPFYERNIVVHWGSTLVCQDLVVQSDSHCSQLMMIGWKNITVNSGLCNDMTGDVFFIFNDNLDSITIRKNSLKNLNHLYILKNQQLKTIIIEAGQSWDSSQQTFYAPFENVKIVVISGYIIDVYIMN